MRILCLCFCLLALAALPALAAAPGRQPYPPGVKERYVQDCMNQPLTGILPEQILEMFGRKVSQRQRYGYCLCLFNYTQETVPYNDYTHIDALVRQGQPGMNQVRSQYPDFFPSFQRGVEMCEAFLKQ